MTRLNSPRELEHLREQLRGQRQNITTTIKLCGGPGCQPSESQAVADAVSDEISRQGLEDKVRLCVTGCHGFCEVGPVMVIEPGNVFYCRVSPGDAFEIVYQTIMKGEIVERLLYENPVSGEKVETEAEVPFYQAQDQQLLSQNRMVNPCSIEDYIVAGGYSALPRVLNGMKPDDIINEIKSSGLRGRGGGGFPTGRKWHECREAPGDEKYVICNADEGAPGAYMDRGVLEGNPQLVLEGMMIGSRAIGARKGYIYVRNEYPLALKHSQIAVEQARELGLLGDNILGTGFDFHIEVVQGAGAFVCGEETALIASIEGRVGRPRQRPPYPSEKGLWGKPTNINNVETWANVPMIILRGAKWFSSIGTKTSKGTKIFSLVGKINNTGLVEVPMGITMREIIYDIGGGIPQGKEFKAVQTGGPSGGCIPKNLLDLPIDYESLTQAGSMMGSGGMIVMDEETCMVDVARYFLNFTQEESCGKCPPCRMGTKHMVYILDRITNGKGSAGDIELLESIAKNVELSSLCGLGQTAPNPVLTTIRYFRHEYEAHIKEKRCPALVCKALISYLIDPQLCGGCTICAKNCPSNAITGEPKKTYTIDQKKCTKCGICITVCPPKFNAVKKVSPANE